MIIQITLFVSDYAHLFATLIARCAKDIDVLIESLPNEDSSTELQVSLNIYRMVAKSPKFLIISVK